MLKAFLLFLCLWYHHVLPVTFYDEASLISSPPPPFPHFFSLLLLLLTFLLLLSSSSLLLPSSPQDRKRWYILRQDPTQSLRVLLEFHKDEKTASNGNSPKGFINIRDVVSVHRLPGKKQSFEILCPGIGYRLSANSELEADEWTAAIRAHICYKREDVVANGTKSLSLNRVQSSGHAHLTPPLHDRQRTMSEPHYTVQPHLQQHSMLPPTFQYHHQQQLLQPPRGIPIVSTHHHALQQQQHRSNETHAMMHFSHSLPTPPDSLPSPPSFTSFPQPPTFQRQHSLEMAASLTSPSTSSDSSSMCSSSNTSFEGSGAVFEADGMEMSEWLEKE